MEVMVLLNNENIISVLFFFDGTRISFFTFQVCPSASLFKYKDQRINPLNDNFMHLTRNVGNARFPEVTQPDELWEHNNIRFLSVT